MKSGLLTGRLLGILAFLIGIALLGYVFMTAHSMFTSDKYGLNSGSASKPAVTITSKAQPAQNPAVNQLGNSALSLVFRLSLLLLMTFISSAIATRGINLYLASTGHINPQNKNLSEHD